MKCGTSYSVPQQASMTKIQCHLRQSVILCVETSSPSTTAVSPDDNQSGACVRTLGALGYMRQC